jgi:hypothetical protein
MASVLLGNLGDSMKHFLIELAQAAIIAALLGAPFFYYFWSMTP